MITCLAGTTVERNCTKLCSKTSRIARGTTTGGMINIAIEKKIDVT